jgi:hypothetical protein
LLSGHQALLGIERSSNSFRAFQRFDIFGIKNLKKSLKGLVKERIKEYNKSNERPEYFSQSNQRKDEARQSSGGNFQFH